jgi:hypothetical protein
MVFFRRSQERMNSIRRLSVYQEILFERFMSGTVTIDVFPCLPIDEGQFIGGDSNNWGRICLVKGREPMRKFAADLSDYIWNVACASRLGAGK